MLRVLLLLFLHQSACHFLLALCGARPALRALAAAMGEAIPSVEDATRVRLMSVKTQFARHISLFLKFHCQHRAHQSRSILMSSSSDQPASGDGKAPPSPVRKAIKPIILTR